MTRHVIYERNFFYNIDTRSANRSSKPFPIVVVVAVVKTKLFYCSCQDRVICKIAEQKIAENSHYVPNFHSKHKLVVQNYNWGEKKPQNMIYVKKLLSHIYIAFGRGQSNRNSFHENRRNKDLRPGIKLRISVLRAFSPYFRKMKNGSLYVL